MNTEINDAETSVSQITMDWEIPIPFALTTQEESTYPLQALPAILQKTVSDYQKYGQQPISLIACGALANVSLACQSLANVARDNYLISPVSLYFIVLASSGERKSASDNLFSQAARSWEERMRYQRLPMVNAAKVLHRAWKMQCEELSYRLRSGSFSDDYADTREELEELMMHEPEIPLLPTLYFEDVTQEALAHSWVKLQKRGKCDLDHLFMTLI